MSETPAYLDAIVSDRYKIERELGRGGMATVYLAQDIKLERMVALKVLSPELGAVLGAERFLTEIKITARLDHPHILTLIDSGNAGGHLFYVLPFVRGESLRDLMRRETQLGVEQALAITKQVASALDYAHKNGVVHRDIKPENILLQEGEAMLADFGIALAVKEAGGDRLTQTGLSLGTPQYMSPEQATGDRRLDARSDVYSLAAVLYEMLVGDPPMSGATVQAVIAKLLTEAPTRVRVVRPSIPQGVDDAIAKALSKVPSDRFGSAGEFVKALEAAPAPGTGAMATSAAPRGKTGLIAAAVAALAVVGAVGWAATTGKFGAKDTSAALRDRRQLTITGNVSVPALSPDGKQLAYFVKECQGATCTYALTVQDVGSPATRRVLEGATAGYGIEWAGDRRNLLVNGIFNGRGGGYLVSALGGTPRFVSSIGSTFYAGGDSLLMASEETDSTTAIRVAGLDGTVRETFSIKGTGAHLGTMASIPGTTRFVVMFVADGRGHWRIIDRRTGQVSDTLVNTCTCGGTASHDALWMTRAGPTATEAVVRVAVDSASGKLAQHQDTIYNGRFSSVSVTADGTQMAVDDGTSSFTTVALPVRDLVAGKWPAGAPLSKSTTREQALVSPDGARVLLVRVIPGANGVQERRLAVTSWPGGTEAALNPSGAVYSARWADSVTVAVGALVNGTAHLSLVDVRTGTASQVLDTKEKVARQPVRTANGWAWVDEAYTSIIVEEGGKRHVITPPPVLNYVDVMAASPDGTRLLYAGGARPTLDSAVVLVVPVAGGASERWATRFADHSLPMWQRDGSIAWAVYGGPETVSLFTIKGPGAVSPVGDVPHLASSITLSADLQRATVTWTEDHFDTFLYKVVKP
jgi:hypothetical protein